MAKLDSANSELEADGRFSDATVELRSNEESVGDRRESTEGVSGGVLSVDCREGSAAISKGSNTSFETSPKSFPINRIPWSPDPCVAMTM
jgi:hypothetical protein